VAVEFLNPPALPEPEHYWQVSVATGSRTVYLSGQVARTADGTPVGPSELPPRSSRPT
jgi:enamine deaminase RidA (YjgF/YER057c/UK114 family)